MTKSKTTHKLDKYFRLIKKVTSSLLFSRFTVMYFKVKLLFLLFFYLLKSLRFKNIRNAKIFTISKIQKLHIEIVYEYIINFVKVRIVSRPCIKILYFETSIKVWLNNTFKK